MSTQQDINAIRAQRFINTYDPLASMANTQTPFHPDHLSLITYIQHPQPNNNFIQQPSFNTNYMQQPMQNPKDISDPTTALDMALELMSKAFQLNNITLTNKNQRSSSNPCYSQIAQSGMNIDQDRHMLMVNDNVGNQFRENAVQNVGHLDRQHAIQNLAARTKGNANGNNSNQIRCYNCQGDDHLACNCIVKPGKQDAVYLQKQMQIALKEEAGFQLTQEEFDFMADAGAYEEIERVNANCTLKGNLQQASTSGTQTDKAFVYDSDESTKVHHLKNCYDNDIFNMFTQEEQYTELLEPIPESHQVPQNDSNVISEISSVEQSRGIVEQHLATPEETRDLYDSLYNNLATEVEKVNSVNRKLRETNADLTTELARYKNQEKCFEISQEKYDKLERCYQKSVYQEQCLTKKINALHLSSGQSIQTMHMLLPKPDSFYHTKQKMALGYQNHFYLKQAHQKQQSLYNGKVLLEKHDPPVVYDSEETLELAQEKAAKFVRDFQSLTKEVDESLSKHKALELEIERLLRAVVSQDIMSIVQNNYVVDTSNLQTKLERMKERFENCIIKKENEYAKLWNDWYKKCEECKYDKISYDKAFNDMQQKIERLQAQLGDQKGKSKDTPCVSNTFDPLPQKLENENVELEFQVRNYEKENAHLKTTYKNLFDFIKVSEQNDTNKGTGVNTQFSKQSILGKTPSSSKPKLYSVTPFPKSTVIPKVGKSNALSKPVTSNSAPSSRESSIVNNERVIALGIFRINPFKAYRVENFMPNKHVKASVRTKPITVSQPHVVTKEDVNSNRNGFSPSNIESTTRTRRPQPRNNPKSDKEPINKRFPSSTFSMTGCQTWIDTLLIPLLSEYKQKTKKIMEIMNATVDEPSAMACNQIPNDEGRVSSNDDGTELSPDIQGSDDSEETSIDEKNNTHHEGTIPNEIDFVNDFYENSKFNSDVEELPVNTVRRSSRQTKLPTSLNDFVIEGKLKYGVEKVVNYANLNHENLCFASGLNESIEPICYEEAILDTN
ncbi:hypothetical protein Tco_0071808 [Tanacetum coccineum]